MAFESIPSPEQPVPGKHYIHYKGARYVVVTIARLEADPTQFFVVYQKVLERDTDWNVAQAHTSPWVRPVAEWFEDVGDGKRRYELAPPLPPDCSDD